MRICGNRLSYAWEAGEGDFLFIRWFEVAIHYFQFQKWRTASGRGYCGKNVGRQNALAEYDATKSCGRGRTWRERGRTAART